MGETDQRITEKINEQSQSDIEQKRRYQFLVGIYAYDGYYEIQNNQICNALKKAVKNSPD